MGRSDRAPAPVGGASGTTMPVLLGLAVRLIDRLRVDRSAAAMQLAEEAAMFASLFARWIEEPPPEARRSVAARQFLQLHHRAAEYVRHTPAAGSRLDVVERPRTEPPPRSATREGVASAAAERLGADASLRGRFGGAEPGPLIAWAQDRTFAAASGVGRRIAPADAVHRVVVLLGGLVAAACETAQRGEVGPLVAAIQSCPRLVIERELAVELLERLRLDRGPSENVACIASALRAATPLDPS